MNRGQDNQPFFALAGSMSQLEITGITTVVVKFSASFCVHSHENEHVGRHTTLPHKVCCVLQSELLDDDDDNKIVIKNLLTKKPIKNTSKGQYCCK